MLRDRLVCIINEDSIQKRLLSETKLTYESAVKKKQAMEAAMEHVKECKLPRYRSRPTRRLSPKNRCILCSASSVVDMQSQGFVNRE